jgi:glycosyltransferase involved in cell wall biosynthesis
MASARGRLRRAVRGMVLGRARAVVGMGRQAREVLEGLGLPAARVIDAPNATDVALIVERLAAQRADGTVRRLREELGAGRRIALVPGRLVDFKGIRELLDLWAGLPAGLRNGWRLVFVGDGPLAASIDAAAAADASIRRVAGVPMREIPGYYAMADLHLFASLADAWGLSVQEAMLCGVPTLCSVHAGCADDLVRDGVDGLLWDPTRPAAAQAALGAALRREDLPALGARAAAVAVEFTPERLADAFRSAVAAALGRPVEGPDGRALAAAREAVPT